MIDRLIEPHPSGVGCYIHTPAGSAYQVFRQDVRTGLDGVPGLILKGVAGPSRRLLDWDLPIGKPVTYRVEWAGGSEDFTVVADPVNTYSVVDDADLMDAPNPRDALVVYYSARLAQLVKAGKLLVHLKEGETESNHAKRYSVRTEYVFAEAELPVLTLDYAGGEATGGDIGHTYTEVPFKVDAHVIATSREERDSLRQAVLGLWRDTEWFLEDVNVYEVVMTNVINGMQADEPPFYTLEFSLTGTFTIAQGHLERSWEMLDRTNWI